jgi:hypothetical protein
VGFSLLENGPLHCGACAASILDVIGTGIGPTNLASRAAAVIERIRA